MLIRRANPPTRGQSAERGFREMIGVIALPNPASIALQHKLGFAEVGVLKNVGCKFGRYIDVSIWQKSLSGPISTGL